MNWDDLRVFLALARCGTLAGAGLNLGVNATTVSRRIDRLESAVGRALFEVGAAGQTLTKRGVDLLQHVEAMERAASEGLELAGDESLSGSIRISVSEGFGSWLIAPNLHSFANKHPDIAVELVASSGFLNPSRREADIAVMLARPKQGPLIVRKLTDYHLGLYGRRGLKAPEDIADLRSQPMAGYVSDLIYAPELHYLGEVAPNLEVCLSSTSVNAQAAIIGSGAAIGVLPCFIGDSDNRLERLLSVDVSIRRSFWVVYHRDLRRSPRVQSFLGWLDRLTKQSQSLLKGQRIHDLARGVSYGVDAPRRH